MHKNILSFRLFVVNCFGSLYFKICFDFSCICCGKRLWEPCCFVGLVLYCCRIMCSFLKSGFKREKCLYHTRRSVAHLICKVSTCSLKRMYLFHKPVAVLRKVGKKGSLPLQSVATSLPTSCCSFSFTKLNRISHTWTRSGLLTAIFIGEGTWFTFPGGSFGPQAHHLSELADCLTDIFTCTVIFMLFLWNLLTQFIKLYILYCCYCPIEQDTESNFSQRKISSSSCIRSSIYEINSFVWLNTQKQHLGEIMVYYYLRGSSVGALWCRAE